MENCIDISIHNEFPVYWGEEEYKKHSHTQRMEKKKTHKNLN
jgi:hypothetical protein